MTDTHQIQFNNYLIEFIQKLQILVPSEKRLLSKYYKYYRKFVDQDKRVEFIAEFIQYLSKYNKEISVCDEGLFSEEEGYYPSKPIQLMKGIDFKTIWNQGNLTEGSKESIWKYLHTLFLIGSFVLKESDKYNDLLKKQKDIIYNLLQSMKYEKQIKADAEKLNQTEDATKSSFDLSNLGELFDENNIITQIALEIAKELNLSGDIPSDPTQAIRLLFGQDGNKLQEIIGRVGQKLNKVLQDKGLTEEQLLVQAKEMHDKLLNKLKGIPGMPNIEKLSQKFADEFTKGIHKTETTTTSDGSTQPPAPRNDKEELEKCQAFVQELTSDLRQNFAQMGIGDLDEFQKNLQTMMDATHTTQTQAENNNDTKPQPQPQPQPHKDEDADLKKELENLKKKFTKK